MPAAAAIMVLGSVASAAISADATDNASSISAAGAKTAIGQKQKFFDIAQEQLAPYRDIGKEAVDQMQSVFIDGNMDNFFESAGYNFNLSEGEKALARKQGAAGSRYGGRALKEAAQYSQGLASNEFQNYFNNLNSIMQTGANAAAGGSANAMNTGSGIANITTNEATNQANLEMQKGQSLNNAVQSGLSNLTTLQTYNDMKTMLTPQPTPQPTNATTSSLLSRNSFGFQQ